MNQREKDVELVEAVVSGLRTMSNELEADAIRLTKNVELQELVLRLAKDHIGAETRELMRQYTVLKNSAARSWDELASSGRELRVRAEEVLTKLKASEPVAPR